MVRVFYPTPIARGVDVIDWEAIDTVLFDMDGTLLDLHYDNYFWHEYLPEKWGARQGMDLIAAKAELLPRLQQRKGTLSWYCLDYWSTELGLDILELKRDLDHLIQLRPQAEALLRHVGDLGKRRIMVTNSHQKLLEVKLARTGIGVHFDAVISAHELGLPKEDTAFWGELYARLVFDSARTLLLDDNQDVLRAAARYGIRHLLAIQQPDSKAPPRVALEFPSVGSFAALLPAGVAQA
ncbi:MAG: haloacid dehalogenase [Gammaproteobacteria bacterium RIFCSPLOWO2_02_FULL_61_13]|nr:MAG: haloacid dehalogenase [Gammaproteobacteria bacterium RIFCSPLOWO2_02_FULL_61_13]